MTDNSYTVSSSTFSTENKLFTTDFSYVVDIDDDLVISKMKLDELLLTWLRNDDTYDFVKDLRRRVRVDHSSMEHAVPVFGQGNEFMGAVGVPDVDLSLFSDNKDYYEIQRIYEENDNDWDKIHSLFTKKKVPKEIKKYMINPILKKLTNGGSLEENIFLEFWVVNLAPKRTTFPEKIYSIIKDPSLNYIRPSDLRIFVAEIVNSSSNYSSLLEKQSEIELFIESVIIKIFFHCSNNNYVSRMYKEDFINNNMAKELFNVTKNQYTEWYGLFYNFNHFYSVYMEFRDLHPVHYYISKEALSDYLIYDDYVVECIYSMNVWGENSTSKEINKFHFLDFLWLRLIMDNPGDSKSLNYWFFICDTDCDGYITEDDLSFFFYNEYEMLPDNILFDNVCNQIFDIFNVSNRISINQFKQSEHASYFHTYITDLPQYIEYLSLLKIN